MVTTVTNTRHIRIRRMVAGLGIGALAAAAAGAPVASRADTAPFSPGTASAIAQGARINPTAAQLSVGITFGLSLAGYQNKVAKADSRGIDPSNAATFTLGSAVIGGRAFPTGDPGAAFAAANQALKQLGMELRAPKVRNDNGVLYLDPLAVAVVPNSARDQISGTILGGI